MRELNRKTITTDSLPVRILQFGEGNFLRAFADYMIDRMNADCHYRSGVAVVQPIKQGTVGLLQKQDNLYHHIARGLVSGKPVSHIRLISCVQQSLNPFTDKAAYEALALLPELKIVVSNTTEAGIAFAEDDKPARGSLAGTFPGKVAQLLWRRFKHFNGAEDKGLCFLPVELIEKNGDKLRETILAYAGLWQLGQGFINWIRKANFFANTLVDRIVPGYPGQEADEICRALGYHDELLVASEVFHLWVIEGGQEIKEAFPAHKCGLNVIYTDDLAPYRTRKVRILNGAHTCMVPIGLLNGVETVRQCVEDEYIGGFVRKVIFDEILPTIDLPKADLEAYAEEVLERFKNPFIYHQLTSIALNSVSKFKVRVLPSVLDYYHANRKLPKGLVLAFTYLIKLYLTSSFVMRDSEEVIVFFRKLRSKRKSINEKVREVLANTTFWGTDLNLLPGLAELITGQMGRLNYNHKITNFMTDKA